MNLNKNRLNNLFKHKQKNILSVYFTAGFPQLNDTFQILQWLEKHGTNLIEIGIPFSDPIADGETIQRSNQKALANGMSLKLLFQQIEDFRDKIGIPVLLMGYLNPVLQFGVEKFCEAAQKAGIDGLILPDLPMNVYQDEYKDLFKKYGLANIFLVTPQTSPERMRLIDENSEAFIYAVSSSSTTGKTSAIVEEQIAYFERLRAMQLKNPFLVGFGISDKQSFEKACSQANGAIIGSAFIKVLEQSKDLENDIQRFIKDIIA